MKTVAARGWWFVARGHRRALEPRAAFTLLEIIIALAVMSIGLFGAIRVFPLGLRASVRAEQSSRATMLAQRAMEELKLAPWNQLHPGETVQDLEGFQLTTAIQTPAVNGLVNAAQLKTILITVRWQENQRPRSLAFTTYVWSGPS